MTLEDYAKNCPNTYEEFYQRAINKPPFDLDWNQRGFNHRSHGNEFNVRLIYYIDYCDVLFTIY